ncbi:MAG: mechanosensitive ion channel family protein [Nitrospirota bacterium]|nr:mechanosensitive ion channel family protein [Nitrospirota bacterium]
MGTRFLATRLAPALALKLLLCSSLSFAQVPTQPTAHDPAQALTPASPVDLPALEAPVGSPVVFSDNTLFYVHAKLGPFTPQDRAKAIVDRLMQLSQDPLLQVDAITSVDSQQTSEILSGQIVIMSVTDGDAAAVGRPRQVVAREYALKVRQALAAAQRASSFDAILLAVLLTVLATVLLIVALKVFQKLFPRIYAKLDAWRGTRIRSIKVQTAVVLSAERITDVLLGLVKAVRVTAVFLLLYLYASSVLSFFPWTQGMASQLFAYLLAPLKAIGKAFAVHFPDVITIIVIVFVTHYIVKLIRLIFAEIERGTITFSGFHQDCGEPTYKIVRFLVIAFAAIAIFPYIPGSNSPAFQAISVFLGVLFSLGSMGAISNIISGVVLTYMRPFKIGDRVKIADTVGDVVTSELLVTRVRTIKNVDVTIPNSMVLSSHIANYSASAADLGLILHTSVTIGYDAPWRTVHELLIAAARRTRDIVESPEPFVLQTRLDDFYVTYELNAYTDRPNRMATTYAELHQNIQDKFNEAGVEIMSPHYSRLRDGNQTTIPEQYLPKTYQPPSFRITRVDALPTEAAEGLAPKGETRP